MNDQPTHRLPGPPLILTINGGSSSIKFALFEAGDHVQAHFLITRMLRDELQLLASLG